LILPDGSKNNLEKVHPFSCSCGIMVLLAEEFPKVPYNTPEALDSRRKERSLPLSFLPTKFFGAEFRKGLDD